MRRMRSTSMALAAVLLVALAARVGAAVWWDARNGGRFYFGDSDSYWVLAQRITRGEPYQYGGDDARVFRTPGYPLVLAGLFMAIGRDDPPVLVARILGAVLGTFTVATVYILGRQMFAPTVGLVAAGMVAIYPGAVAQSVFVLSEGPFCAVMVPELIATWAAWRASTATRAAGLAALAGLLAGVATLIRPSWLLFAPAVAVGRLVAFRSASELTMAAAMLVGFVVAMTPWWIRNAQVTGRFVPTTLQVGASLYDGLNPRATGASDLGVGRPIAADERRRATASGATDIEWRIDRRLRDEAIVWTIHHPRLALELAAAKFVRLWNIWPNEPGFRAWPLRLAIALTYVPLVALALFGAGRSWFNASPERQAVILCWLPAVYLTVLHVVFVSSLRYREPAMLGLAVVAAAALVARGGSSAAPEGA